MAARRLFSSHTHHKKRNGGPGTWPAHDQDMTAHDKQDDDVDDDDVDNVDNVDNGDNGDNGDNVDNHPRKYII